MKSIPLEDLIQAPSILQSHLSFLGTWKPQSTLVVCINKHRTDGRGYLVGMAEKGIKGYTPTNYIICHHNYNEAKKVIDHANRLIYNRPPIENAKIVLSTL